MKHTTLLLMMIAVLLVTACSTFQPWMTTRLGQSRIIPVSATAGNPVRGEEIFRTGLNDAPPCVACHQVSEEGFGMSLGPKLTGISARARERVAGFSAEAYIEDSILYPQHHVVPGFHISMYPDYAQHFSEQDVSDLVAFLMTL